MHFILRHIVVNRRYISYAAYKIRKFQQIELRSNVPLYNKYMILGTIFPGNLLANTENQNQSREIRHKQYNKPRLT